MTRAEFEIGDIVSKIGKVGKWIVMGTPYSFPESDGTYTIVAINGAATGDILKVHAQFFEDDYVRVESRREEDKEEDDDD